MSGIGLLLLRSPIATATVASSRCTHASLPSLARSAAAAMSTSTPLATPRRRVAIIGAGPAGLAMASQLLELSPDFKPVLFERRPEVGGVWTYDSSPGPCSFLFDARGKAYPTWTDKGKDGDDNGIFCPPGPMYDGLRTNLPCDLMAYRDLPFDKEAPLFPQRSEVEEYINQFAQLKLLDELVRFETAVVSVQRIKHEAGKAWGQGNTWQVQSRPVKGDGRGVTTEEYDYIVSASGRCNTPSVPFVDGLWNFKGQLLHSAWYRYPTAFRDKTVLVVGNSSSGSDIARELVGHVIRGFEGSHEWIEQSNALPPQTGVKVYHSYQDIAKSPPMDYDPREEASPPWTKRINVVPKVQKIEPAEDGKGSGSIMLENGQVLIDVDAIVFGTGYSYDLPYLPQSHEPFLSAPVLASPRSTATSPSSSLTSYISTHQHSKPYVPPFPTSPFLSNMDDWSLLHLTDPSLAVLGAPIRIVPFPFTHAQARVVAAFWAGRLSPRFRHSLPRLNKDIPVTEPEHWRRWIDNPKNDGEGEREVSKTLDLGYLGDTAYQDGLSDILSDELRRHGRDEERGVQGFRGQKGIVQQGESASREEIKPTQFSDEGWARVAKFRIQRRETIKRLRREMLGY